MNKEEFLKELTRYLSGVSEQERRDVVDFYNHYFAEQEKLGKSEKEIIEDLGDPRLLAKSIKEMQGTNAGQYQREESMENNRYQSEKQQFSGKQIVIDKWYFKLAAVGIGILILLLAGAIIAGLFALFVKLVIPVLFILIIVGVILGVIEKIFHN